MSCSIADFSSRGSTLSPDGLNDPPVAASCASTYSISIALLLLSITLTGYPSDELPITSFIDLSLSSIIFPLHVIVNSIGGLVGVISVDSLSFNYCMFVEPGNGKISFEGP